MVAPEYKAILVKSTDVASEEEPKDRSQQESRQSLEEAASH